MEEAPHQTPKPAPNAPKPNKAPKTSKKTRTTLPKRHPQPKIHKKIKPKIQSKLEIQILETGNSLEKLKKMENQS